METSIPAPWRPLLGEATQGASFLSLAAFVEHERAHATVYPPAHQVFAALELTAPQDVRVVLLGQDPYHGPGQAHGLCFSVCRDVAIPPSLRNIHKELEADLGLPPPAHGDLTAWARQGVLLLNTVLTVRAHEANSHRARGWEAFTDAVIRAIQRERPVVFVLWGGPAQKKAALVDATRHAVVTAAHPSPLSAYRGFLGARPFSAVNAALERLGQPPLDWRIPG